MPRRKLLTCCEIRRHNISYHTFQIRYAKLALTMTRTLSLSDGKKIPALGWGNGTGGLFGADEKAAQTGQLALDQGIYHIDTAQVRPS